MRDLGKFHLYSLLENTLVLTPFALNIHDTYIVNNHGAELKAKAPPSIWLCYVSDRNCHRWYIGTCGIHIKLCHHVTIHIYLNNPNQLCSLQPNWEGAWFLRIRRGNAEPWAMGEKPCATTTLIILLLVGVAILLAGKLLRPHSCTLSTMWFGLPIILSTLSTGDCSFFLM